MIKYKDRTARNTIMQGVTPSFRQVLNLSLKSGRWINEPDDKHRSNVLVLGAGTAETLFPSGIEAIDKEVELEGKTFRVIGVLEKRKDALTAGDNPNDNLVAIPIGTFMKMHPESRNVQIAARPISQEAMARTIDQIENLLRQRRGVPPSKDSDFAIFTQDAITDIWNQISSGIFTVMLAISSVASSARQRHNVLPVDQFGPRLSFFLDCGLDVEYIALSRVSRKIWAIGMRDVFGASPRGQMFKLHTQTSGRSLIAAEFKNNLTRTAAELMLAYMNGTNSCHSNSADEPFTTPSEEWIRLAAHGQAILLEESGIFKHTMNMLSGSPGMKAVERAVEKAILDEFREIESLGGVLGAVENRYQRSQIQNAAHRYEQQIYDGTRPIVGLTRYRDPNEEPPKIELARTPRKRQELQVNRLKKFKKKNAGKQRRHSISWRR